MRLLDVGCGWGSLSLHAAEHFGAQVTGVTIAAGAEEVHRRPDRRARPGGPGRDPAPGLPRGARRDRFDAVGSLEMGEHVGEGNYPTYV